MLIVTSTQMKTIEKNSLHFGLSYERLMENAGSAAAAVIRRTREMQGLCATVFCGCGNNGGDGFVVARKLCEAGADAAVVLTDGAPRSREAQTMLRLLDGIEVPVVGFGEDPGWLADRLACSDLLVDAVYGTGFHGELDDRHRDICRLINGVDAETVSLDMPSGVAADTGAADEYAVRAETTVVFDSGKPAAVLPAAQIYCGRVVVADIGIPPEAKADITSDFTLADARFVFDCLPPRMRETHKGSYGKLLCIAGARQYMGAAALCTQAALRTGAGYVTLASTRECCRAALPLAPEAVMLPLKQTPEGGISAGELDVLLAAVEKSSAVLLGNGLGGDADALKIVYEVIRRAKCPLILDADGINAASRNINILREANCEIVLTPHIGELSRLTTLPIPQLQKDLLGAGQAFAREYGVHVVLKDAYTCTVSRTGHTYINTTGNAGLARAGSGDVLAGVIGSLAAQGHQPELAAACGVWLHGAAGDCAAAEYSEYGMLPRDVITMLSRVFRQNGR